MYDREGEIQKGKIRDPWKPLRELTNNLLPHLSFARIDTSNRTQVRCLWNVHTKNTEVDLDDLSSGEKSIIQMFYPLVEKQIKAILREVRGNQQTEERAEMCVLIDEPELHLHPNLQMKVFDYLRKLVADGDIQFILATHSPTVVEYSTFDELFLLRPVELIEAGENQLVQLATDEERLRVLRDVFGTTSNVTALQTVVVVEGVSDQEATKSVADRKLYRALHPGFDKVTLIAGGGKGECIKLRGTLAKAISAFSSKVQAFALLDRDLSPVPTADGVHLLPVAMIENLLLDPNSIWEALQSVLEKTPFSTVEDIAAAIDSLLDTTEQDEVERRALGTLGIAVFRPKAPVAEIVAQLGTYIRSIQDQYAEAKAITALQEGNAAISKLKSEQKRRELFHGKEILHRFFKQHLHSSGMAKGIFLYESARHAKETREMLLTRWTALLEPKVPVIPSRRRRSRRGGCRAAALPNRHDQSQTQDDAHGGRRSSSLFWSPLGCSVCVIAAVVFPPAFFDRPEAQNNAHIS